MINGFAFGGNAPIAFYRNADGIISDFCIGVNPGISGLVIIMQGRVVGSYIYYSIALFLKAAQLDGIVFVEVDIIAIDATLEVHIDLPKGPVISTLNYQQTGDWKKFKQASTTISDPGGIHDLYFVFKKDTEPNHDMFSLDWLRFEK